MPAGERVHCAATNTPDASWSIADENLFRSVEKRHAMLTELFAHVGEGAVIRPRFHLDDGYTIATTATSSASVPAHF